MSGSIGAALASFADLSVRGTLDRAGARAGTAASGLSSSSSSFASQLEASFQARAKLAGIDLPALATSTLIPASGGAHVPESANDIWKRAQMLSIAAGNGPGDAMMKSLADAADARAQRRHSGADSFFG